MIRPVLIAAVGLLLVAGCNDSKTSGSGAPKTSASSTEAPVASDAPSSAAAGSKDPCVVLTAADIGTTFGGSAAAGAVDSDPASNGGCIFDLTGTTLGESATLTDYDGKMTATQFGLSKQGLVPALAVSVDGIGDDAFYSASTDSLTVLVGDTTFVVEAVTGTSPTATDDEIKTGVLKLGGIVASRL